MLQKALLLMDVFILVIYLIGILSAGQCYMIGIFKVPYKGEKVFLKAYILTYLHS